jgi:Immunity protein 27
MKLAPHETLLTGQWLTHDRRAVADATCDRVNELVRAHLKQLAANGWDTLLRDPADGRLWELTYPQGHLHGGGPPQLQCMAAEDAKKKYGVVDV